MADSRYNRLDNTAPVQTALKADDSPVGRSVHDFSCIRNGNALIGALHVVDCFDVVPNEDIDLSLSALIEFRNPTTRQLFNGFRVFFHAYYNRLTDLWEGAQNWIDNGRSGKLNLNRPNLIYHLQVGNKVANSCTPLSLLNDLGLPAEYMQSEGVNASTTTVAFPPLRFFQCASWAVGQNPTKLAESVEFFPADCAFAYQKNWRDFYCNKNLLMNNKFWFPDNEAHFILSYECTEAVCVNYGDENLVKYAASIGVSPSDSQFAMLTSSDSCFYTFKTPEANSPSTVAPEGGFNSYYAPNLSGLKFRQFRGDRFTTALPFPDLVRGDIPVLAATNDALLNVQAVGTVAGKLKFSDVNVATGVRDQYNNVPITSQWLNNANLEGSANVPLVVDNPLSTITMSDLYTLETLTAFRRRMGMTNGDYNETIKAQFGVSPNVHDGKGTYIGGFYQDFALSSVTQQSESGSTPLGTKAGQGVSSGSGSIGHFNTPDFGWIQIYMSIVPDVYYTQGKHRMFSKKSNLEMYFPIFNNLPAQAILNKELYISGETTTDNTPFAYEDRYAEYKSRQNRVSGLMALSPSVASFDASRIIARRFSSTPALNSNFVTMIPENIDMSVFTVADEPPFDYSIGISCRRVFPGPYAAIEGSLSSPSLNRM